MKVNYTKKELFSDLRAGFITAIVALPLAIAFALASGVSPIMGLYTAIIAGILGSAIGGSRYSITGPTGAMTVIILSTVNKYGIEGLFLAGLLAGVLQILFGVIKLGKMVKFIPISVIAGFTAGIGAIIFIGQISNFLGLDISAKEHIWQTIGALFTNISSASLIAMAIAGITILLLIFFPKLADKYKFLKNIPASIIALLFSALAMAILSLEIPNVGIIPKGLPSFDFFKINFELIKNVLPSAFTIALLGAIEALLCAVVCDAMTNTKHESDKELVSQGICNVVLPFFGAIPCTAAIARSAVNIREGAKTRVAGIIHAIILLMIVLFFAPLGVYISKAFLAGILMVVSVRMINFNEIKAIVKSSRYEAGVLGVTFILTVLTDLVFAVQIGMLLAIFILFIELTSRIDIRNMEEYDSKGEINAVINSDKKLKGRVSIYTIHGPFFFGAMNVFNQKIEESAHVTRPVIIIRMKHVPFIDASGMMQLISFLERRRKMNSKVLFTEFWPRVKSDVMKNKHFMKLVSKEDILPSVQKAIERTRKVLD